MTRDNATQGVGEAEPHEEPYAYCRVTCGRKAWHYGKSFDGWEEVEFERGDYQEDYLFRKLTSKLNDEDRKMIGWYGVPAPDAEIATKQGVIYDTDALRIKKERGDLLIALENLVQGLEKTNWSSWQSTSNFWSQKEAAEAVLAGIEDQE